MPVGSINLTSRDTNSHHTLLKAQRFQLTMMTMPLRAHKTVAKHDCCLAAVCTYQKALQTDLFLQKCLVKSWTTVSSGVCSFAFCFSWDSVWWSKGRISWAPRWRCSFRSLFRSLLLVRQSTFWKLYCAHDFDLAFQTAQAFRCASVFRPRCLLLSLMWPPPPPSHPAISHLTVVIVVFVIAQTLTHPSAWLRGLDADKRPCWKVPHATHLGSWSTPLIRSRFKAFVFFLSSWHECCPDRQRTACPTSACNSWLRVKCGFSWHGSSASRERVSKYISKLKTSEFFSSDCQYV